MRTLETPGFEPAKMAMKASCSGVSAGSLPLASRRNPSPERSGTRSAAVAAAAAVGLAVLSPPLPPQAAAAPAAIRRRPAAARRTAR